MKLKTFTGKSMAEVLKQVKEQFGADAVILNTRTLSRGRLLGLGSRSCVEITAARAGINLPPAQRRVRLEDRSSRSSPSQPISSPLGTDVRGSSNASAVSLDALTTRDLISEVGALKVLVGDLVRQNRRNQTPSVPDELYDHYLRLVQCDVAEHLAQQIVDRVRTRLNAEQLSDAGLVREEFTHCMEAMLPTAGPIQLVSPGEPTVIALIGPTGVGKTTTIAKLAANFCLRQRRKVGFVTLDTYRIAAVEQLRTYAQILDVPLEVVVTPEQYREAVMRMIDRDVILIDTAGRSQRDAIKIRELRGFFQVVRPHEVHLVLSGTYSTAALRETIEGFQTVGVDRVIFTKLDEAIGFGVILSCLQLAKLKLSYVTSGQSVPDDISVGEGKAIADLILGDGIASPEKFRPKEIVRPV